MPQATDEQRARWGGIDGVGEDKAVRYLRERGYTLTRQWTWIKPSPDFVPAPADYEAIQFLIDEWDFAGLEDHAPHIVIQTFPPRQRLNVPVAVALCLLVVIAALAAEAWVRTQSDAALASCHLKGDTCESSFVDPD